jgi:hypothetical protein
MDKQSQQTQVAVCNASTAAAFAAALVAAALECFRHAGSYLFANQLRGSIPARLAALRKLSVLCVTAQPFGHSARPAANDSIRHSSSSSFGLCSHLHTNRLSGTLPSTLGELLDLEDLYATRRLCIAAGGGG